MTEEKAEFLALLAEELAAWDAMRQATVAMNAVARVHNEEYNTAYSRWRREMAAAEAEVVATCARYRKARQTIAMGYRKAVKGFLFKPAKPYARGERPDSEDRPD